MVLLALADIRQYRIFAVDILADRAGENAGPGTLHLLRKFIEPADGFRVQADA